MSEISELKGSLHIMRHVNSKKPGTLIYGNMHFISIFFFLKKLNI